MAEYKTNNRYIQNRKRRRKQERAKSIAIVVLGVLLFIVIGIAVFQYISGSKKDDTKGNKQKTVFQNQTKQVPMPELDVQLLTVNPYSRPGIPTDGVQGIVVHYLANPGSTAQNNRDYFESLKDLDSDKLSSNFVIGLEGEIIQCVPTSEIAYASNSRNSDTVSIECCHPDETGKFNDATYQSLVELVAFLCGKFNLTTEDVIRHYDVTGKICPKYFVENEDAWEAFKEDIDVYIEEHGV